MAGASCVAAAFPFAFGFAGHPMQPEKPMPMDTNPETLQGAGPIVIRRAALEDAAALAELMTALGYPSSPEQMQRRIATHAQSTLSAVFVAVSAVRVVGLISFYCLPAFHADDHLGRITSLVVDTMHRRRGIGQQLMAAAEEFGRASGCARIEVTSGDHRADAHAFYERLGYHCDCRRFIKCMDAA